MEIEIGLKSELDMIPRLAMIADMFLPIRTI